MEKDLMEGKIGDVGSYDLEFKGGKLLVKADVTKGPVTAGAFVAVDAKLLIEALKKAIPGVIDDAILDIVLKQLTS